MLFRIVALLSLAAILAFLPWVSFADVFMPDYDSVEYFDSTDVYTIVRAIKNTQQYPVQPTLDVVIQDGDRLISQTFDFPPILPTKDLPIKLKFPEVTSKNPEIKSINLIYVGAIKKPIPVEIIYGDTLIRHPDGHVTGRIINKGDHVVTNIRISALVNGEHNRVLDMVQNSEQISRLEPGDVASFTMYPDPTIVDKISFYSCYAIGDETVIPVTTTNNGREFKFRYDSVNWFAYPVFSDDGKTLTLKTQNNLPLENYANFEFPSGSPNEKFEVFLNDKPIKFIQSIDEQSNWHVAFILGPYTQGFVKISGFEPSTRPMEPVIKPSSEVSPLKQSLAGVAPTDVVCKEGKSLILKTSGYPACVKNGSVQKLLERGWILP